MSIRFAACIAAGLLLALPAPAQNTYTWSTTTTSSTWASVANWTGGPAGTFPGLDANGSTPNGAANDIATIGAVNFAGNSLGIEYGIGSTGTSGQLTLGAIDFAATLNRNLTIGKSDSFFSSANLQLGGATLGGTANVILRNASSNNVTIAPLVTGGSSLPLTLVLGNTANTVVASGSGNITISAVIGQQTNTTSSLTVNSPGTGAVILAAANTYTGTTTVASGTLLVNGSIGNGAVTVANNGRLGGAGTINGATTVQNGGRIFAGDGTNTGSMTVSGVTIQNGGTLAATINGNDAGVTDSTLVFGANALNFQSALPSSARVSVTALSGFASVNDAPISTYTLATFNNGSSIQLNGVGVADGFILAEYIHGTGNVNNRPVTLDMSNFGQSLVDRDRFTLQRSGNNLTLVFTPVPEPGLMLAGCGLAVGGVVAARRLRRKGADLTPAA